MSTDRNAVGWFEIYVQDVNRAKSFYEQTFGVVLERIESPVLEMWAFPGGPDKFGAAGALVKMAGKDSGVGGTLVYFPGDDCETMARSAVANGGRLMRGKMSIGQYGFISLVYDTEGNLIGLHSME